MAGAPVAAADDSAPNGMPASIPELLRLRRSEPDGEFLVADNERLTFAEADAASLDLADALLASGVGKGTRVGTAFNRPASRQRLVLHQRRRPRLGPYGFGSSRGAVLPS